MYNRVLVVTAVVTILAMVTRCYGGLVYPTTDLFVPILERICYDEILDSCDDNIKDLAKPGYQVYCMLCRGGVFNDATDRKRDRKIFHPEGTINFANLQTRFYGCFADKEYVNCAMEAIYKKFKDVVFDLYNPGSKEFVSLQQTLAQIYDKDRH